MPGGISRTWLGDIGMACGQSWYYSRYLVGTTKDGDNHYPACTWLDTDRGDSAWSASLKADMFLYTSDTTEIDTTKNFCSGTIFSNSTKPISEVPSGEVRRRSQLLDGRLIISLIR
jgi:hypothetical protein